MIGELFKKYRWYLIAIVVLHVPISLWLFLFTDSPQTAPFEYEIRGDPFRAAFAPL